MCGAAHHSDASCFTCSCEIPVAAASPRKEASLVQAERRWTPSSAFERRIWLQGRLGVGGLQ